MGASDAAVFKHVSVAFVNLFSKNWPKHGGPSGRPYPVQFEGEKARAAEDLEKDVQRSPEVRPVFVVGFLLRANSTTNKKWKICFPQLHWLVQELGSCPWMCCENLGSQLSLDYERIN